jgi:hypothetical protein
MKRTVSEQHGYTPSKRYNVGSGMSSSLSHMHLPALVEATEKYPGMNFSVCISHCAMVVDVSQFLMTFDRFCFTHIGGVRTTPSQQTKPIQAVQQHQRFVTVTASEENPSVHSLMSSAMNPPHLLLAPLGNANAGHPSYAMNDSRSFVEARLQQMLLLNRQSHLSRSLTATTARNVAQGGGNDAGRNVLSSTTSPLNLSHLSHNDFSHLLLPSRNSQVELHVSQLQQFMHGPYQETVINAAIRLQRPQSQGQAHETPSLMRTTSNQQHQQRMDHLQHRIRILQQQNQQRLIDSAILQASTLLRPSTMDSATSTMPNYTGSSYVPDCNGERKQPVFYIPGHSNSTFHSHLGPVIHASGVRDVNFPIQMYPTGNNITDGTFGERRLTKSASISLPVLLARPNVDEGKLSEFQCLLRQQIEVFEADNDDVLTHVRGRNTPVTYGQVGLRCIHCAHLPVSRRQKGSAYFPSNRMGIYQAAQNMSTSHIQCGLCDSMPDSIKEQFASLMNNRIGRNNHGAGRSYWANSVSLFSLVDTEHHGIRFLPNLPSDATIVNL